MTQTVNVKMYKDSNYNFVDATEVDQGAAGNGGSVKDIVDSLSAGQFATMVFGHTSGTYTTTYTFSTDETIPYYVHVIVENGAILAVDNGVTVTCNGPFDAPLAQVISLTGTGAFDFGNRIKAVPQEWFGNAGIVGVVNSPAATVVDTEYTAPSDGIVIAWGATTTDDSYGVIRGESPTATIRCYAAWHLDSSAGEDVRANYGSLSFPVKRGDTWKVVLATDSGTNSTAVWFYPLYYAY